MIESPQQHEPNQQMTSTTNIDFVPELTVPELTAHEQPVPELTVPEQPVSEFSVSEQTINNQSSTTNTFVESETSVNDQPSSSNLAIKPCAPARTKVPSPPTLFLDSTILADVCENVF